MRSTPDAGGKDLCRRHDLLGKNSALDCGVLDGAILSFYGFQSKAHSQPESAVTAIAVVFCVGVIALAPAAIVFSKQMKLDRKAHLVVLQEVARIKAGGKISDIAPDVRVIVEDLVGHRYEECWGNSKLFKDAALRLRRPSFPIKEEGPAGIRRGPGINAFLPVE